MAVAIGSDLKADLEAVVGPHGLIAAAEELLVYECDGYTLAKNAPDAVVFPESTRQAADVLRVLHRHGVPFIPRGAGTSLAGGCLPVEGGVFISTARMKRILRVDARNRRARVEAGVINLNVSHATAGCDLHYAPDPSSQMACTIGGNVGTNAGGPHTLKYGVTVNHTLGATLVLPDGRVVEVGGEVEDAPGLDLTGVVVGSEGTFGLITEVIVRLTRNPAAVRTMLGVFESVEDATRTVGDVIGAGIVPAALEMMDKLIIRAVEGKYHFGFPLDAEAVLIIELDGLEAGIDGLAERVIEICRSNKAREVQRATTPEQRMALWKCRKRAFGAIGRLAPSYCTQDGVVPRARLPDILRFIQATARKYDLTIANVFHAGDGNIHPILLFDERDADQTRRVLEASADILAECVRMGGSVTGEHGIGVEKLEPLKLMFNERDLAAQRRLREVFDPDRRANPYKIYATGAACVEVLKPMRRAAL
ncbi:MAG: FAD-binding protein [Phycisphaerae bacterium]|jgi:glycolate oxidase